MGIFYSRLSYSFGNEDPRTEHDALQIQPDNHVLCITASGDRPLHLLMDNPQKIVSVDANPIQTYLLKLKIAAIHELDPTTCLSFLGATESPDRTADWQRLSSHLDKETADFWAEHLSLIRPGIIYQGAMERRARHGSLLFRLLRSGEIKRLYSMKTLEDQRVFLKNEWNHTIWRNTFRYVINSWFSRLFVKDPGLYANVDPQLHPGLYLYDRMMGCLDKQLARENPLVSLVLRGSVEPEGLPPYLTQSGVKILSQKTDRIQAHTANIITYMEAVPENSFDRFSLSDIASYMDQPDFLRMLKAMFRAAKPGARFCMRQFMSRYKIPEGLRPYFQTEPELEKKLEEKDGAFVYHFTVGKVLKD